jgi:hypothetical protein
MSSRNDLQIEDIRFWSGGITIQWSSATGFGEIIISKDEHGQIIIDSEDMSREFVKAVFMKLAEEANF